MSTTNTFETTTLRNGAAVLAKTTKYGLFAKSYANRTQANNAADRLAARGIKSHAAQFMGRPFYVVID